MIELALALTLQPPSEAAAHRRLSDPCIVLGRGYATVDGQRFQGRALRDALIERLPVGRPLFLVQADPNGSPDLKTLTEVLSVAQSRAKKATSIVFNTTCEASAPRANEDQQ